MQAVHCLWYNKKQAGACEGGDTMGFQMTGAALMLLFYGCYIVKMMAQRKKGIRTD